MRNAHTTEIYYPVLSRNVSGNQFFFSHILFSLVGIKDFKYLNPKLTGLSAYLDIWIPIIFDDLVQDEVEIRSVDGVILVLGRRVSPNVAFRFHQLTRYAKWAFLRLEFL